MLINLHKAPFDNIEMQQAMVFSLNRKAFNHIENEHAGAIGANMLPRNSVGMPPEVLEPCPVTGPTWRRKAQKPRSWKARLWAG